MPAPRIVSTRVSGRASRTAATAADAAVRTALDATLMRRDTVTAGIARGESSVRDALAPIARELRRALGYTVPPLVPVKPVSAESGT